MLRLLHFVFFCDLMLLNCLIHILVCGNEMLVSLIFSVIAAVFQLYIYIYPDPTFQSTKNQKLLDKAICLTISIRLQCFGLIVIGYGIWRIFVCRSKTVDWGDRVNFKVKFLIPFLDNKLFLPVITLHNNTCGKCVVRMEIWKMM